MQSRESKPSLDCETGLPKHFVPSSNPGGPNLSGDVHRQFRHAVNTGESFRPLGLWEPVVCRVVPEKSQCRVPFDESRPHEIPILIGSEFDTEIDGWTTVITSKSALVSANVGNQKFITVAGFPKSGNPLIFWDAFLSRGL